MVNAISKRCVALGLFVFFSCSIYANNIQVANVTLTGQNTVDDYTLVEFDISWENSWRVVGGPGNWDAAWVFVKYRIGAGPWLHAWINSLGHTAPSGSTIEVGLLDPGTSFNNMTNPGMGVFIYRSSPGSGTFALTDVKLRWNYGDNGLSDNEQVDIKVFAIEHVYVPQGPFYVGSGGSESGAFYTYDPGPENDPYLISSEGAINVGATTGYLYYQNPSTYSGDQLGPIPASFPKGYDAFYFMKYEVSQKGYVDFLNSLSRSQQMQRVRTDITMDQTAETFVMWNSSVFDGRNGIRVLPQFPLPPASIYFFCDYNVNFIGNEPGDGQDIACNWLTVGDLMAYLDWTGLRIMAELEYEKCGRGPIVPTANEFAWGNNYYSPASEINNAGYPNEKANDLGNCNFFLSYPMRCGCFATSSSTRESAGAGYFGSMELSGNVWERCVSVGHSAGRLFDGRHGNGILDDMGYADVQDWPSSITPVGSCFRGGCAACSTNQARLSDREFGANPDPIGYAWTGGRGGRTAP